MIECKKVIEWILEENEKLQFSILKSSSAFDPSSGSRGLYYKTFYGRNLQIFIIS